jgi:glycosyltransferase involved in cell wall biosynthesis
LKSFRKSIYQNVSRRLGILSDVWLHAASPEEFNDIQGYLPWSRGVLFAPNIRTMIDRPDQVRAPRRVSGPVHIVLVGRISPVKNIAYAIEILSRVRSPCRLEIYGPLEDPAYWNECASLVARLPSHIEVARRGTVANADIPKVVGAADLFLSPTLGENFGHAIFEALSCGVPVLISDRTPWKDLAAQHAGWELPLDKPQDFSETIDTLAAMGHDERAALRRGARAVAERFVAQSDAVIKTLAMLETVLAEGVGSSSHALAGATENAPSARVRSDTSR